MFQHSGHGMKKTKRFEIWYKMLGETLKLMQQTRDRHDADSQFDE